MANPTIRIVLTGGGTGGHTFPLVAINRSLLELASANKINLKIFYFGPDDWSLDIFKKENIKTFKIVSGKLNRYFSLSNFSMPLKLIIGFIQNLWLLLKIMPDAIISKGGYGALPTVIAGWLYLIPIIIHESDTAPGLVNKISRFFAKSINASFPSALSYFPEKKTKLTGNPIRKNIFTDISQEKAKNKLGFNPNKSLILIIAGSQGAEAINDIILRILPQLVLKAQILHQVGEKNIENIKKELPIVLKSEELKKIYQAVPFLEEENYSLALKASDLVISRAGSSIFEIAASGKPAILIPFPYAAGNHQKSNAYEYAKYGGAEVIEQANLLPNLLLQKIIQLTGSPEKLKEMGKAALKFSKKDAADIIAQETLSLSL